MKDINTGGFAQLSVEDLINRASNNTLFHGNQRERLIMELHRRKIGATDLSQIKIDATLTELEKEQS